MVSGVETSTSGMFQTLTWPLLSHATKCSSSSSTQNPRTFSMAPTAPSSVHIKWPATPTRQTRRTPSAPEDTSASCGPDASFLLTAGSQQSASTAFSYLVHM